MAQIIETVFWIAMAVVAVGIFVALIASLIHR